MKKSSWKISVDGRGTPVTDIMSKFWKSRGIDNPAQFMEPSGNILESTYLHNIDKAGSTVYSAIVNKAKFLIYADVDTDGCTSAAILYHYLTAHEVETEVYINEKKKHGIQEQFFDIPHDADIIVVVDSINDEMDMYERIWAQGKQLVILDHHIPNDVILTNARALNLVSSAIDYLNPHLSGSGVTWKFTRYLDTLFGTNYAESLIDLAATGIIADVCSVGLESMENREICHLGFKYIFNSGLRALVGVDELTSDMISYSVAPLINAANRMNENRLALDLFLTESSVEAKDIVKKLGKIRDAQRAKVAELFPTFDELVEPQKDNSCYYFFVDESVETLGGLLATKASDKWKRPCLVLHDTPQGYAGSMRSVGVEDFRQIINNSNMGDCQGHENSAGVTLVKERFDEFKIYIENALKDYVFDAAQTVDIQIERMQVTPFLIGSVRQANRISGAGFPSVCVFIENIRNYGVKKLSQGKHLCVEVPDMKFLLWNFNNWDDVCEDGVLSAIGGIDESFFMGRRTNQMIMSDYVFQSEPKKATLW